MQSFFMLKIRAKKFSRHIVVVDKQLPERYAASRWLLPVGSILFLQMLGLGAADQEAFFPDN